MSTKSKFRIGIIGAGIGGLSLSAGLGRLAKEKEVEIHIYEAAPSITEIGAGINIWPRTWDVLKSLGLESGFLKFLPRSLDNTTGLFFQVRKSDCAEGIHIEDLTMKGSALRFHRAQLQQALFSQMSGTLHLSHRLVSYEERGEKVILEFANGRRATCDLLIGMDGINSTVRKLYLSKQGMKDSDSSIPIWSGDTAYRALIPTEKLQAEFPGHRTTKIPVMYVGKAKHVIVYPVSHEKFINCVFFTKDISKEGTHYSGAISSLCTQDELWSHFRDWDEEVRALIKCSEKPTKWIIRALNPLDHYATGRVILAGDAAHAMTPHQGMGAGQAIEDAYVLASLIADDLCVRDTLTKIGEIYNAVRVPVANATLEKSRLSGNLVQLLGPGFEDIREGNANVSTEKLLQLTSDFKKMLEWTWMESADADRARALQMLRSSVEQESYGGRTMASTILRLMIM